MSKTFNSYLQVLLYLKQFEGDGQLHDVENIINLEHTAMINIISELAREEYIMLHGGYQMGGIMIGDGDYHGGGYIKAEAKLTLKGAKYLKEELNMIDNNQYNIHIGDNSTANLIVNSPGSKINNKGLAEDKIAKIIETLQNDATINQQSRFEALQIFNQLSVEIKHDKITETTWSKVIGVASDIASIGSLALSLIPLFK